MKIYNLKAKPISYSPTVRNRKDIKYIVIHYTGNAGDTAKANAYYFATSNKRQAGAHFFVDKNGKIYKSINMNRTAWAVGGLYTRSNGAGSYYGKCTNKNSVSVELCDCRDNANDVQALAVKHLIKYIRTKCPNAKKIIRHWDVNGKCCPAPMCGTSNAKWKSFLKKIK